MSTPKYTESHRPLSNTRCYPPVSPPVNPAVPTRGSEVRCQPRLIAWCIPLAVSNFVLPGEKGRRKMLTVIASKTRWICHGEEVWKTLLPPHTDCGAVVKTLGLTGQRGEGCWGGRFESLSRAQNHRLTVTQRIWPHFGQNSSCDFLLWRVSLWAKKIRFLTPPVFFS